MDDAASDASFKLVSYNIHKAIGTDRKRDPVRILKVLGEVDADIVILQEADRRFGERERTLPDFLVEQHTDYVPVPFDVQHDSMGWHGNTIMVRRDIAVLEHDVLHIPFLEPRGVVTATLRLPAGPELTVFGMHLDLSGLWRVRQARAISRLAQAAQEQRPTLLAGDLNEWRPNGGCLKEFARHFTLLDCGRSFHSLRPLGRLDRIMHGSPLEALAYGVHRSALASRASDHLPVWAEFRLPG
ncbi:endonuclease/exonuclease/phosphatase family protein [Alteriqipengyuania lutimaris]|uniref:Endonuclease n=1 Tax=Alteriqipengyuania lutimaris TaxID=1538146 RepID=A0A395LKD8_9SPHN|nr:endonuclease/exonuclease/phosphatase family protein [Alteriqipengyuania lutimaris]MBB3033856.1 endonuclease/exonuclease/phosphatase family metal-dependent hydrolase [Alteriqipengyuania lutimaris]RDS77175.1 endonuclease [Alteriqipengyuania lutimaris]